MPHRLISASSVFMTLLTLVACQGSDRLDGDGASTGGSSDAAATEDVSVGSDAGTRPGGADSGTTATVLPSTGQPAGTETECDGVDNDADGYVDNVDVGGDGICDCLSIATLGSSVYEGRDTAFAAWLDERGGRVEELRENTLTPEVLAQFDVIVVQDVKPRAYDADETAALDAWVRAGGGLFTLTAYTDEGSANVNGLLEPYGVRYDDGLVAFSGPTLAVQIEPHPVTEMVDAVGVAGAYQVSGDGDVIARAPRTVLDTLGNGTYVPVGRALEHGQGRLIVWGDEWITFNSEWVTRDDFQVERFWQNALLWLGPMRSCQVEIPDLI